MIQPHLFTQGRWSGVSDFWFASHGVNDTNFDGMNIP
jgi:hypothetical protein